MLQSTTRLSFVKLSFTCLFLILTCFLYAANSQRILINEFLALNSTGLQDEDGDYSDWIELYNPGDEVINLEGWHLTDNQKKLTKWTFPAVGIGSGDYLIVFASDKDRKVPGKELHTNFKLSGDGEYLAIVEPEASVISHEYAPQFPPQQTDISYGLYMNQYVYFTTPTPGSDNELSDQVLSPTFSTERGFFDQPFTVELNITDPETAIYYTTDGTRPTAESQLYSQPIQISTTTPLSAVGIKNNSISPVITHTYYFTQDIVKQPSNPAGYPDRWGILNMGAGIYERGERVGADYKMDPTICNDPAYSSLLEDAFRAIPSVSIVTNPGYIFSHSTDNDTGGIYIYTGDTGTPASEGGNSLGREWERPASIEYFDPKNGDQFQINCGLRLHGGNSRKQGNSLKHSFRVSFRKQYGAGKLNFKLFEDETATQRFDHLVFRAGYNFSWTHNNPIQRNNAQYILDSFAKKTQLSMGHVSPHDRFVHLYINGLYWGMYDVSEKINDNFLEAYLGGKDKDYDVINDDYTGGSTGIVDGDSHAYDEMFSLGKNGNYKELISRKLLDMENFIDYILLNFYIGNMDWGKNNWFTGRSRVDPENGFCYYSWDAEHCMTDLNLNKMDTFEGPIREILFGNSKTGMNGGIYTNPEFKLLLADRIQKHFFNDGALTPENAIERYQKLAAEIDLPIITESARWGDTRKKLNPNDPSLLVHTRNDHWLPRKEYLLKNYFPERTNIVFEQLRELGLYPAIDAPVYNSKGGKLTDPVDLTISSNKGTIYYTIDGTDPRVAESSFVSPTAYTYKKPLRVVGEGTVKARVKDGETWSAINDVSFTGGSKETFIEDHGSDIDAETIKPLDIYFADNSLYYTLHAEGDINISVFTVDGRIIFNSENYKTSGTYQTQKLNLAEKGIYMYRIEFKNAVYTGKFQSK